MKNFFHGYFFSALISIGALLIGMANTAVAADIKSFTDWQQFLSRSDMVWTRMPANWNEGAFTGNGTLGTMFWQNGRTNLVFEISRTDVYDHRSGSDAKYNRCRLPNGHFNLNYVGTNAIGNMRLDLWNAEVNGTVNTSKGSLAIRTFTHAIQNVIVIEITATGNETSFTWTWNPDTSKSSRIGGTPSGYLPYPVQQQDSLDGVNVSVQSMPEDAKYSTQGKGAGQYATAWKIIDTGNGKKIIYISEGFSYPGTSAKQEAVNVVNAAVLDGINNQVSTHRQWWHEYYAKSFISLPDSKAESFYWIQMYKMASATRADKAVIDLMGPWFRPTQWPAIWWDLNIQLSYWPFYVSNHSDLANSLLNFIYNNRNNLAINSGSYSNDSYSVGRTTGTDCLRAPGTEVGDLAYALNDIWQQYRCSMDDDMLQTKLFPLMKGAFNYLSHLSYVGTDRKIHIDKTLSPEYPGADNTNDCNYTLSLFKWLSRSIVYANDRLNLNDPIRSKCQNVIDSLVAYPADQNGFMIGKGIPYAQSHRHWSHLFMVYPLFEYTYDNPAQVDIIDKSLNHWLSMPSEFQGYSWLGAASIYALSGKGNDALNNLNTFLARSPLCNTFYQEGPPVIDPPSPVIETPLYCARAIQDMVLQSYNTIIRVFPAAPALWSNIEFEHFVADGAFLVSAKRRNGITEFIRIESLAGEPCKVKTDMPGVIKAQGSRTFTVTDMSNGVVGIDLQKGEYAILFTGSLPELTIEQVEVVDTINFWGIHSSETPSSINQDLSLPIQYKLESFPNPFNASSKIIYQLSHAGMTKLKIFDLVGREVATLVDSFEQAGRHEYSWDAASFCSGVYFCKMQSGSFQVTKKMILMK